MNFAQTLKVARVQKNLSQKELGSISNISQVTISNIENGVVRPQESTKIKIEKNVGIVDWERTFSEGLIHRKSNKETQ